MEFITEIIIDLSWKIPLLLVLFSAGEYAVHKYILHGHWLHDHGPKWMQYSYHDHAVEHHGHGYNELRPHIDLVIKDYFLLTPFMAIACVRFFYFHQIGGLSTLISQITVCILHMILWNSMHRAIHGIEPNNLASRLPWYNFIRKHHEGHHKDVRRNLNVVLPLCDYLLCNVYKVKLNKAALQVLVKNQASP